MRRTMIGLAAFAISFASGVPSQADSRRGSTVSCPVVVDRQTGKFANSKAKYRCFSDSAAARRAGFGRHSFDDSVSCGPDSEPTPGPDEPSGGFNLSGPGQRESVVFLATNGGSIDYTFLGGGEFEIKVLSASTGNRLQELLETTSAGSSTIEFSGHSAPVVIKVEGPGAWTVAISVN